MRLRTMASLAVLLLLSLAVSAGAATVQVQQAGLTFSPDDITIDVGDTVEWVWSSGFHTVTNGTGGADPDVGNLFDLTLTSGTVSYTFQTAGDVPYFCRPHEGLGMAGIVRVQGGVAIQESSWSRVKALF